MKNNKQIKKSKHKKSANRQLRSTFFKYSLFALVGAAGLNILINLIILPAFDGAGLWLAVVLNLIPYLFMSVVFTDFFRKKIRYIKKIRNETRMLRSGNFDSALPIQGEDELTAIAKNINTFHQQYDAKSKAETLAQMENHQIITSVSREIHAPLTSIIAYLERMQNDQDDDQAKKDNYLATALKKSYHIKAFIEDLFDRAFTDDGKGYYQFKVYNGKLLLNRILDTTTAALKEGDFNIVVENCLDQNFSLWVDFEQIQRVFDNLVSNIIKYADPEKPVDFGLILNKNELCIILRNKTLTDSGTPGKNIIETAGSSLDSCKKIITRHQGRIDYYQLNQLFKVEITLPIHQ